MFFLTSLIFLQCFAASFGSIDPELLQEYMSFLFKCNYDSLITSIYHASIYFIFVNKDKMC